MNHPAGILALTVVAALAMPAFAYDGPIIDMHLHAWPIGEDGPPDLPKNIAAMGQTFARMDDANVVLAATSGPEAYLNTWGDEQGDRLMLGPVFPCIQGLNPTWFRYRCFEEGGDFPNIAWLEEQYVNGAYTMMGELYNQYAGIAFADPRMDPYYEIAERLSIPVAFHTHGGPPLTAQQCCPDFRIANGNPLLIEDVLVRYPKLKAYIMHANPLVYPEVLNLLTQYPKVYVDISPWDWALPREKFHRLLYAYQEQGLLGRVMFGSDGHSYTDALEAYTSAEFLSGQEIAGIFCKNAARFLRRKNICD